MERRGQNAKDQPGSFLSGSFLLKVNVPKFVVPAPHMIQSHIFAQKVVGATCRSSSSSAISSSLWVIGGFHVSETNAETNAEETLTPSDRSRSPLCPTARAWSSCKTRAKTC